MSVYVYVPVREHPCCIMIVITTIIRFNIYVRNYGANKGPRTFELKAGSTRDLQLWVDHIGKALRQHQRQVLNVSRAL